ncbi:MAG: hypothetical protein QM820_09085 [Minicystis sp.]
MLDAAVLAGGLRAAIRLRDKVVIVEIDAAAAADPAKIEALAADLALARALGIRVIIVTEPGAGPGPLDVQAPALRLRAALERHGERGLSLPAAGIVMVHRIPMAALAAAPGVPSMIPVVDTAVLIHLSALGHVPILLPPIADAEGAAVDLGAGAIAVFVAQFMSAALLVLSPESARAQPADPGAGLPPAPPIVALSPITPGSLVADILLHAPSAPAEPAVFPAANMAFP